MIFWEEFKYIWLFLLLLAALYLLYDLQRWRKNVMTEFADVSLRKQVFSGSSAATFGLKNVFLVLSIASLIIAVMGPMWGEEEQTLKREGIDMVVALDLSTSMNAEDVAPNRLEKSRLFLNSFLDRLGGDRVGLVVFAGDAYVMSPLTNDYIALKGQLNTLQTELLWKQGTNIASAIHKGVELLGENPSTGKAILIISDGEDHEGGINIALDEARKAGVEIFTIGVGTPNAVPIPEYFNGELTGYKEDDSGRTVITKFSGDNLREIARTAKGSYTLMTSTEETYGALRRNLDNLQRKFEIEVTSKNRKAQFQWFLLAGLIFLFMHTLTPEKSFFNR